jgi:hypothetical protein
MADFLLLDQKDGTLHIVEAKNWRIVTPVAVEEALEQMYFARVLLPVSLRHVVKRIEYVLAVGTGARFAEDLEINDHGMLVYDAEPAGVRVFRY